MTDQFDDELRDRLVGLAAAVPVEAPGSTTVVKPRIRSGSMGRRLALGGLIPVLAVAVIGTVIAGVAKVGPFAPGATEGNGPVVATTTDGPFQLSVRSAQARYAPDEPIEIEAALTYQGSEPSIDISHAIGARSSPLGFGIAEPVVGDLHLGTGWEAMCNRSTLNAGSPMTVPFQKGGAWSGDHPRAEEYRAYVADPVLRLAAGTWHVYAVAEFSIGECSANQTELRVEIEIQVLESAPTASELPQPTVSPDSPQPSDGGPVVSTVTEGAFQLTVRSAGSTFTSDETIDVVASLTYTGPDDSVVIGHGAFGPIGFFIRNQPPDITLLPFGPPGCTDELELERGVPVTEPIRDLSADPGWFSLPPRSWEITGMAGFHVGGCDGPQTNLRTSVEFAVVLPEGAQPTAAPHASPGQIQPDGSVLDVENDGTFELRLRAAQAVYLAGEVIDLSAEFAYLGSEPSMFVSSFSPLVGFDFRQLDGTGGMSKVKIFDGMCRGMRLERGVFTDASVVKVGVHASEPVDNSWFDSFLEDPTVRLPAGNWRITAALSVFTDACSAESHGLQASIDIKVVPVTGAEIELRTASAPAEYCRLAMGGGRLTPDPRSGLGLATSNGEVRAMIWPFGYTGREEPDGAVLVDPDGHIVAREGALVRFVGATATSEPGWSYACSGIGVVESPSP